MSRLLLVIAIFCSIVTRAQMPTQGLIAYYPFCGNTNDVSGNGYNLTNNGAVLTTDRFGNANQAYEFVNTTDYMYRTPEFSLPADFTLLCWVKPDVIENATFMYNGHPGMSGYGLIISDPPVYSLGDNITVLFGGVDHAITQQTVLNQWHHSALRVTGGTTELFVDNVLAGSNTTLNYLPASGNFLVGGNYTDNLHTMNGKVDEVLVYDRALTNAEITQIYNYQCGLTAPAINPASNTIPVGGTGSFSVTTIGSNYQWQENIGLGWTNLANGGIYGGVTTNTLTLANVPATLNGAQYRCIFLDLMCCVTDTSDVATLVVSGSISSACATIANLPDTIGVCKNSTFQLNPTIINSGTFAAIDTTWSPAVGLSDPNISNPIVTLGTSNQTYVLTINSQTPTNLVVNGDFSAGATGFTSDYIPGTGGAFGLLSNEGQYAVSTNPNLTHINFASYGDHTSGTGQMMVVNGSGVANANIWCQTIAVSPNTDYNFSAWFSTAVSSSPAILQFAINGTQLGTPATAPSTTAVWSPFNATWNSGSSTTATICVTNQNTATSGNDFAIDDIEFRGICEVTDTVTFKVANLEVAIDTNYRLGCASDTVDFMTILNAQAADEYYWDFGDGTGDTTMNASHVYPMQGTYNVRLIAHKDGCYDTATIQVNTVHFVSAKFTASADSICMGEQINFESITGSTYVTSLAWDFGDGSPTETIINPQHAYPAAGTYTVTLVANDFIPCYDTATMQIYVADTPVVSIVLSDSLLCEGEGIVLNGNTTPDYNSFVWDFGDATFNNTDLSPVHAWDTGGVYVVSLYIDYALCPDKSASVTVSVFEPPTVNVGPDTSICNYGDPYVVSNISYDPANTYIWNTGDTNVQSVLGRHHGVYALTVISPNGCSAADSMTIFKDCYIDIPNAFTPNGDNLNDYFLPRQLLAKSITGFHMSIYNRWGQEIYQTYRLEGRGWDGKFNGVDQPMGVYMYLIEAEIDNTRREMYKGNVTLLR